MNNQLKNRMKRPTYIFLLAVILSVSVQAQKALIYESDEVRIYDTYISEKSIDNLFPTYYKEGLLYISGADSRYYSLYYAPIDEEKKKITISSRFRLGGMATKGDEIYFSGIASKEFNFNKNLTVYKGLMVKNKVTKIKKLKICNYQNMYAHPSLSPSGEKMILVTNEKGRTHLLELKLNENGEWERNELVFITHPSFDIINPTYFNEDTIYFASNHTNKGKVENVIFEPKADSIKVVEVIWEPSSYNIYRIDKHKGVWQVPYLVEALSSDFDDLGVLFTSENEGFLTTYRFNNTDNIYYFEIR